MRRPHGSVHQLSHAVGAAARASRLPAASLATCWEADLAVAVGDGAAGEGLQNGAQIDLVAGESQMGPPSGLVSSLFWAFE